MSAQYYENNKFPSYQYSSLNEETNFTCNVPCLCKFLYDRTNYDKMQMMDTQVDLPTENNFPSWNKPRAM